MNFHSYVKDDSFGYFIAHVHELKPITLIMIGLGGLVAFWFGVGRETTLPANTQDESADRD